MDPTTTSHDSTARPDAHVVVVGSGLAGLRTVERLRRGGHVGAITLVGSEGVHPYDRPPLSKSVLVNDEEPPTPLLRAPEKYAELDLDLRLDTAATGLDPHRREVQLADGSTLSYDTLVIATGSRPSTVPSWTGVAHTHVLRTIEDARDLRRGLREADSIAVVGAGVLGCEIAAAARALDVEVSLIDAMERPMARVLPAPVSAAVADLHTENGVRQHLGVTVDSLHEQHGRPTLTLSDGTVITPDLVVVAVGSTPNIEWLRGSGLELADGVVCDSQGRSSDPRVWAVGDVAARPTPADPDTTVRLEHWTAAGDSAARVAAHLLGKPPATPVDVGYFWSDQFGEKVQTLGDISPDHRLDVVTGSIAERRFLGVLSHDDVVTGAVGMGMPAAVMRCRQAIERGEQRDELLARAPWEPKKKVTT